MGAAADCEAISDGLIGQPVNALTSLAFVIVGIVVVRSGESRSLLGAALLATGVGSFLFHGPMPPGSEWAHDVSLAWLLVVAATTGTRWFRWAGGPAFVLLGVLAAFAPPIVDPLSVLLAVGAIASVLLRDRGSHTVGAVAVLAVSAAVGRLGATGWPLCAPDSVLQTHALWHLGAAGAVGWWSLRVARPTAG